MSLTKRILSGLTALTIAYSPLSCKEYHIQVNLLGKPEVENPAKPEKEENKKNIEKLLVQKDKSHQRNEPPKEIPPKETPKKTATGEEYKPPETKKSEVEPQQEEYLKLKLSVKKGNRYKPLRLKGDDGIINKGTRIRYHIDTNQELTDFVLKVTCRVNGNPKECSPARKKIKISSKNGRFKLPYPKEENYCAPSYEGVNCVFKLTTPKQIITKRTRYYRDRGGL